MRLLCAVLAVVVTLSCGAGTPSPTPTSPTTPTPPTNPNPTPTVTYVVSGTVRDNTGAPIADVNVFVGCGGCKSSSTGFSQKTNAAGAYSGRVAAGHWDLFVTKPGYVPIRQYGTFPVSADTPHDITIRPGVTVSGRTYEQGVGLLTGVRVEVIGGPNDGLTYTTTANGVGGYYNFELLPGTHRIRASKDGYDTVERTVEASIDTGGIDFTLKWSYGSCLRSVSPVFFNGYSPAGGEETVTVDVNPGRNWSAAADQPWINVSRATMEGSGRLTFSILPHPLGASDSRSGAIMIRCSATEGQNIWIVQKPDCQIKLSTHSGTPDEFQSSGGIGHMRVDVGVMHPCRWQAESLVDWMHTAGVSSRNTSTDDLTFVVRQNTTGAPRTGILMVGEKAFTVRQR